MLLFSKNHIFHVQKGQLNRHKLKSIESKAAVNSMEQRGGANQLML